MLSMHFWASQTLAQLTFKNARKRLAVLHTEQQFQQTVELDFVTILSPLSGKQQ